MAESDPFVRVLAALRARGATVSQRSADEARATCPAHADRRPSLGITRREGKVLMNCFAGCAKNKILDALGLQLSDLFSGPPITQGRAVIVATYDYVDLNGEVIAQKVRFLPKGFRWRRPDPSTPGGWRSGLDGRVPGLYRWPDLIGAPVVILVEGENAVNALWSLQLPATCGWLGASAWKPEWSAALSSAGCREIVIVADHDQAGAKHAERVATDVYALYGAEGIAVKIVDLPGLARGGDVVDFLEAGHDRDALLDVVAQTPLWAPGAAQRRRDENRRARHRDWMRKHRAESRGVAIPVPPATSGTDADALDAIKVALDGVTDPLRRSGRALKRALRSRHSRQTIENALLVGVGSGDLVTERGPCGANLYRLSVSLAIRRVTKPGHSTGTVPHASAGAEATLGRFPEEIPLSQCPVTPCTVTLCERSSSTLQGPIKPTDIHRVTGDGTLMGGILAESVPNTQPRAVAARCCGKYGDAFTGGAFLLHCKLCAQSPIYWQRTGVHALATNKETTPS